MWTRLFRILFFGALFCILFFFVWVWYSVVYHPENRVETMKREILEQAGRAQFDEKRFQRAIKDVEEGYSISENSRKVRDIFYAE